MGKAASSLYLIGIDLGTTHSSLSYCALEHPDSINTLPIPQINDDGTVVESAILPSFLYFPTAEEPLQTPEIGKLAQKRGEETPARVVSSAKSWLCHEGIDRRSPCLPLGDDIAPEHKVSPQDALSSILQKLRHSWDAAFTAVPFEQQKILVTVPASFDPAAKQLVLEAAASAGYPEVTLIEEPLAAFYAWLQQAKDAWRSHLKVGDSVLVVDIGGGTTDFTLIDVEDRDGNLELNRAAVGSHLLLGGDNIDHLLAHLAQQQFAEKGTSLSDWQYQSLVHSCRKAKEQLFGENPPASVDLTILGRGSKLIGGSLKTTIELNKAEEMVLEGFFPLLARDHHAQKNKRSGFAQVGLPYAQDARISAQLATFLDGRPMPTKVLFNGGTMKADAFRKRIVALLGAWSSQPVEELTGANYDFGVSVGAVCYALAREGKAIRIRSGAGKSYYVAVEESAPAVPGFAAKVKKICVVPCGMEEGSEATLESQEFSLWLGEQVTFRFFSKNGEGQFGGYADAADEAHLEELHPIETILDKEGSDGKTVQVKLKSKVTELGFLELWCESADKKKWKLEFNLRAS
jgi:molecular chaperone DnaK (HSP70)